MIEENKSSIGAPTHHDVDKQLTVTTFIHSSCSASLITNNESLLPLLFSVCSSHWNSQFCLPRPLRHYLVGAPYRLGTEMN